MRDEAAANSRSSSRVLRWLHAVEDTLISLLLAALVGFAAYQVIARNLGDGGLLWGDALVRVLVFWITLVGAMIATRRDEHIRIDALTRFFNPFWRRQSARLAALFACLVCALLAWHSYQFVLIEYEDGVLAFASVPAWACEAVLPVGAAIMCLRYLLRIWSPR